MGFHGRTCARFPGPYSSIQGKQSFGEDAKRNEIYGCSRFRPAEIAVRCGDVAVGEKMNSIFFLASATSVFAILLLKVDATVSNAPASSSPVLSNVQYELSRASQHISTTQGRTSMSDVASRSV